jgi:hypothetical protein
MKGLALLAALAASLLCALPSGAANPIAAPPTGLVQPTQLPVPAEIVAAHPGGVSGVLNVVAVPRPVGIGVSPNDEDRISCWRGYFSGDNSGWLGEERQSINPYWCGNGSVTRGVDSSWHWQSCSWLVSCRGESGVGTWYGCANGCSSIGQQIVGHFQVDVLKVLSVDITVAYELYAGGGNWSYAWHN